MIRKTCIRCGKKLKVAQRKNGFCSQKCYREHRFMKKCFMCGKDCWGTLCKTCYKKGHAGQVTRKIGNRRRFKKKQMERVK